MSMSIKNFSNKKRNIFLCALLSCSAIGTSSFVQAETLAAKTSWAVSRVVSSSQGSYCTMAQRYADDTTLTLARNMAGEFSLAIDFKKDQFKKSGKQSVGLSSQGDAQKTFNVTPKSERTLVVNLGSDSTLVDKIATTESLSIDINGQKTDFTMAEFKNGQSEMAECMGGLKNSPQIDKKLDSEDLAKHQVTKVKSPEIAEPTAETLLAVAPMPSAEINPAISPEKEKAFIRSEAPAVVAAAPVVVSEKGDSKEIALLKEENARLSRAIFEQRQTFENAQSSKSNAAMVEVQTKLDMMKNENEKLKQELAVASSKVSSQKAPDDSEKFKSDILALTQSIKSLEAENQELKNKVQLASVAKPSAPSENGLNKTDEEIIKLRNELRQLSGQSDVLKTENATLKTQIADLQNDIESKQIKATGGNWDLEQSTRRYQESQREIVRLGALLQAQDSKCTSEKKDIEYMLFDPAIADKAQISMLNSLEDQIKEKDEKLKKADAQVQAATTKVSLEKDAEIASLKKSIIQTKLDYAEKLNQTTKGQDELIASLKSDLDKKTVELNNAQSKVAANSALEASVATKQQSLDSLKAELAQKNQEVVALQAKVSEGTNLKTSISSKDQAIEKLTAELSEKNKELATAQAQVQIAESKVATSVADSQKNAEQTIQKLTAELSEKNKELATAQAQVQMAESKIASSVANSQKNVEQATMISNLQMQVLQANQKIADLQGQINQSKTQLIQASASTKIAPALPIVPVLEINTVKFKTMDEISSLLKKAGIVVSGNLKQISGGDTADYKAYSWKTDRLHGSVEMRKISDVSQFSEAIEQYLSRAKARCQGEFAAIPAPTESSGMAKTRAYEIACIGSSSSSSASVMFSYGETVFTTIAHEGNTEVMDLAIDARDKVAAQF